MDEAKYCRRTVDTLLDDLLREDSALLITGPRASGKTTTALQRAASIARLDVPAQAAHFHSDPDSAVSRLARPLLIDEWQFVPEVLSAIKRAVDTDSQNGSILITGSSRSNRSPELWPGTGRIFRVPMYGLTEAEIAGVPDTDPVARLLDDDLDRAQSNLVLADYVDRAVRGGMPQPRLNERDAARWYGNYVAQIVDTDAAAAGYNADADLLIRYVRALAENTAGVPSDTTLYQAAGITAKTARRYDGLLDDIGLLGNLPAWSSNRLKRMTSRRKVYLTDTGLAAATLGLSLDDMLSDGALFGRFVDAFVAAQLRPALAVRAPMAGLHHLRSSDNRHEIDLLIDLGYRGVIAIEVKAAAGITEHDARHLVWLRDSLGDRFLRGIVLHTGLTGFALDERIVAAPISALWES